MIGTSVVFERRIAECQPFSPSSRSKSTNQTTEQDEHNGSAKHFIIHKIDAWSSSDGYDCEGSSRVSISQTEHQPHTIPALSHRPSHDG